MVPVGNHVGEYRELAAAAATAPLLVSHSVELLKHTTSPDLFDLVLVRGEGEST